MSKDVTTVNTVTTINLTGKESISKMMTISGSDPGKIIDRVLANTFEFKEMESSKSGRNL